jgi:hypothetical protein
VKWWASAAAAGAPNLAQAPQLADLPGGDRRPLGGRAMLEHVDGGDLGLVVAAEPEPVPHPHGSREHPRVGDLLPRRAPLDLEHPARDRAAGVASGGRQQLGDGGGQRLHPGAGDRRAEVHRVDQPPADLRRQLGSEPPVRDRRRVVEVGGQQRVVVVGEQLGQPGREPLVGGAVGDEPGAAGARVAGRAHRHHRRGQLPGDLAQDPGGLRAAAVELVHEQEGGDAEAAQGPQQDAGLGLDPLDGGDDQHGAVEHVQHPLHLGDEVRVAGRVDQVDGDVADDERHHRGLDGDAALTFQGQGVGLGAAVIHAAELVDDAGGEQQPLGQGCLTGVDMRQDPKVQVLHEAFCPRDRGRGPFGWT